MASPILKWAGSKRLLAPSIAEKFQGVCQGRYFEPFSGSAALYLHLQENQKVDSKFSVLNDRLLALYATMIALRDDPQRTLDFLYNYLPPTWEKAALHYKDIREEFNKLIHTPYHFDHAYSIAARMIWLNRACFNGLYRENKSGNNNVPIGSPQNGEWTSPIYLPEAESLLAFSKAMPNYIFWSDWTFCLSSDIGQGDWVYFDPPYAPNAKRGGGFTSYGKNTFGEKEQILLANSAAEMVSKGARVVLSNSNVDWIRNLYQNLGFQIEELAERRSISSKSNDRGKVSCLLISAG